MEIKVKPKKCKECKESFTPYNSLQVVCSPKCAMERAKNKEKDKKERQWKIKKKEMDVRSNSGKHKNTLQSEVNKLARSIDALYRYNCIDCGRSFDKQVDGAHYHNVGSHPETRYNLHNIHSATNYCNVHNTDHKIGYKEGIKGRYGSEYLEMMDGLPLKYKEIKISNQEVYDAIPIVRKLNRDIQKMKFKDSIQARNKLNKIIGLYL